MKPSINRTIIGVKEKIHDTFWAIWNFFYAIFFRKGCAFYIGRFAPPHKGHINVILWLLTRYERVVIGIGSCYEKGTSKHPLLAIDREKMLLASLEHEGVDLSRIAIVHVPDYVNNFAAWWGDIMLVVETYGVTHFVTGNEEQILNPLKERNIEAPFIFVNPEKEIPKRYAFFYHATNLREAIMRGDYEMYLVIAAWGTILLGKFKDISQAMNGNAVQFIPGRQAVDLIITCNGPSSGKVEDYHVVCGYRKMTKENFPGYLAIPGGAIEKLESPLDAVIREGGIEETGLEINIVNRITEPTIVVVAGKYIAEMRFIKLFSTDDPSLGGMEGGSSQVFHIHLDISADELALLLRSESDLEGVAPRPVIKVLETGLAYQQTEMLQMVASQFGIYHSGTKAP